MHNPRRLTEDPDRLVLGPKKFVDYDHPTAAAFSIINQRCVAFTRRTHPSIFNALKVICNPDSATDMQKITLRRDGTEGILDDYGVQVRPALTAEDMAWYKENWTGEMGEQRMRTLSGRVWKDVTAAGERFSAVSFWCTTAAVNPTMVAMVLNTFGLGKLPIYVEYIDSPQAEPYDPNHTAPEPAPAGGLRSKLYPQLSEKEIIDIIVKAHTSPQALSAMEKQIVDEFRGNKAAQAAYQSTDGYNSMAQRNFMRRLGDSLLKNPKAQVDLTS